MFSNNLVLLAINNIAIEDALACDVNLFDTQDVEAYVRYVVEMERGFAEKHYALSNLPYALPIAEFA